ncbi:MAG: TRAP transporter small permease [Eubacteriales bacterium]|nr:TRAP transporter small permease [Eubacteriales bacterium]
MKKLDKILDNVMRFLMAMAMLSLVVGGFWQIFTRWILNDPSTFTEEFMRYMLIWASMLGSAYCFYKDKHLTLDLFKSKAKGTAAVALNVFIEAMIMFFVIYVFVYGGGRMAMNSTNASPVMQIPFKVLYMILPLSGCFIVLARVLKYIQLYLDAKENKKEVA